MPKCTIFSEFEGGRSGKNCSRFDFRFRCCRAQKPTQHGAIELYGYKAVGPYAPGGRDPASWLLLTLESWKLATGMCIRQAARNENEIFCLWRQHLNTFDNKNPEPRTQGPGPGPRTVRVLSVIWQNRVKWQSRGLFVARISANSRAVWVHKAKYYIKLERSLLSYAIVLAIDWMGKEFNKMRRKMYKPFEYNGRTLSLKCRL